MLKLGFKEDVEKVIFTIPYLTSLLDLGYIILRSIRSTPILSFLSNDPSLGKASGKSVHAKRLPHNRLGGFLEEQDCFQG
jgi:hypothetical protein